MNIFLLGGWAALPSAFYFCGFPVFSLSYCVGLVALSFVVALPVLGRNVPVLILTALCHPCLFLVGLAFPHRLVKSINDFPHNE